MQPTSTEPGATARMTQLLTTVAETPGGALAEAAQTGEAGPTSATRIAPSPTSRPVHPLAPANPAPELLATRTTLDLQPGAPPGLTFRSDPAAFLNYAGSTSARSRVTRRCAPYRPGPD